MCGKVLRAGFAAFFGFLLVTALHARAQDEPSPVDLRVGETFEACASGLIVCPARSSMCDDPKVAVPADTAGGLGFRGVGPGTTLCAATSSAGPRRVFRVTVR